jgi:NADH dehydrogenase [ubiquinone] 1 alpha subcomplex assembly factor 7
MHHQSSRHSHYMKSYQLCAGARCYGPVQQGAFLMNMGIVERTDFLIEQDHVTEAQAETIVAGLERLVDPQQMGSRYKVS